MKSAFARRTAFAFSATCALVMTGCQSERTVLAPQNSPGAIDGASTAITSVVADARLSVGVGDTVVLEASRNVLRGRFVRWTSSNPSAARVDSRGTVIATGIGEATITDASLAATERRVFDVGKAVASITVAPDPANLVVAGEATLVATLRAQDGSAITGRRINYRSLSPVVATVAATGRVVGVTAGSTSVLVSAGNTAKSVAVVVTGATTPPVTPPPTTPPPTTPPPTTPPPTTPPPTTPPPTSGGLGLNADLGSRTLFPANNPWNQPVDTAQVDPNSAAIIANIGATKSFHPDFGANWNGGPFGIPYFVVSGTQLKVPMSFDYYDESDPGPYPVPANAPIEGGASSDGDRHVLIVDRDNWKLYELYYAFPQGNGSWHSGAGAVFDLSSNALRPAGWTSADAAGLPILPGLVRYDEVTAGAINHAVRFTVSRSRKAYIPPARHWASSDTSSLRPPMGMRVRLKASVNINTYPASAQVILRALKKYGMIMADNGSDWYVSGTADARWNDNEINSLKALKGSDFEVVKMTGVVHP